MSQCESKIFFPDDPKIPPQFSPCPRQATTSRRTTRLGDKAKGEPALVSYKVKLCSVCAKHWDEAEKENRVEAVAS